MRSESNLVANCRREGGGVSPDHLPTLVNVAGIDMQIAGQGGRCIIGAAHAALPAAFVTS